MRSQLVRLHRRVHKDAPTLVELSLARARRGKQGGLPLAGLGALTIISNVYGNPAISIPAGFLDGLPAGIQVLAPHHHDARLLDVALAMERAQPWPLTAASARIEGIR